ncbi:MAG: VCBS repeat-containing protein, partial [Ilumatobacter sp.]|nr:VCBS repeat-containing protein [Ilumatobacter sp.]
MAGWGACAGAVLPTGETCDGTDDNCDGVIDERDDPEVIWSSFIGSSYNNNGTLHAASITDGQVVEKWSVNPQSNRIWPGRALAGGDLDGQPGPEIVACQEGSGARAFHADGSDMWTTGPGPYCDQPSIADLDGDGSPEVLLSGAVLDGATGAVKFTFPVNNGTSWWREKAIAVDVDDDDALEIVTGSRVFDSDGTMLADTGLTGTYPSVADLDGDGSPEIIVVANLGKNLFVHHIHVWRYDANMPGNFEIVRQDVDINGPLAINLCPSNSNGYSGGGGPPTVAEFNGDGTPDVGVAGGIGYAVFDGAKLMDPNTLNADTLLWIKQTQDCSSSFTGSSVYDFNGNGRAEVVYADEEVMRIYRGTDGEILAEICNTSGTLHEYPLVTDLDHDGKADLVVSSNNYSGFTCPGSNTKTTGVRVFSNVEWTRTRNIWNQHAYHVTNINDDGTIPAVEPKNWQEPGLNNFRLNYIDEPFALSDLVVTEVWAECGDPYTLVARVRNIGRAEVPKGVTVGMYAGDPDLDGVQLGQLDTTKTLYPA